jgi:hypothetical protein
LTGYRLVVDAVKNEGHSDFGYPALVSLQNAQIDFEYNPRTMWPSLAVARNGYEDAVPTIRDAVEKLYHLMC